MSKTITIRKKAFKKSVQSEVYRQFHKPASIDLNKCLSIVNRMFDDVREMNGLERKYGTISNHSKDFIHSQACKARLERSFTHTSAN
jgi:hypothetical protein